MQRTNIAVAKHNQHGGYIQFRHSSLAAAAQSRQKMPKRDPYGARMISPRLDQRGQFAESDRNHQPGVHVLKHLPCLRLYLLSREKKRTAG
jgi:hypothetical protein